MNLNLKRFIIGTLAIALTASIIPSNAVYADQTPTNKQTETSIVSDVDASDSENESIIFDTDSTPSSETDTEPPTTPEVPTIPENGWYIDETTGSKYYYENSIPVTGEKKIDEFWYYFDLETGIMLTGWQDFSEKKVYYNENGQMQYGLQEIDGISYYFDVITGALKTNTWINIGQKKAYCTADGSLAIGEVKIDGKWYCFRDNHTLITGWHTLPGKKVYYNSNGQMVKGEQKISGYWYYFDPVTGAMKTGFQKLSGKKVYYSTSGRMLYGEQKINGYWYYFNKTTGKMTTGWYNLPGKKVYYNGNGQMVKGEYKISGYWYYFNKTTGKMTTGWCTLPDKKVYYNSSGHMVYGKQIISGKQYYFNPTTGKMTTGWAYHNGYKFYYDSKGVWVKDVHSKLGKQSSYYLKVNRKTCTVTAYAKDGNKGYIIPVKSFACSVGLPSTPTPKGTFYTSNKYRWHTLMGPSYGQYCTRIVGGVLFHSVAGRNMTSYNLSASAYNKLGQPASHGCVRLNVRDAKWIYDNCKSKTKVTIFDGSSASDPLGKPATIKIPAGQTWDPTDPAVRR